MRRFRVHPPETRRLRHGPSHKEAFTEGLDQNKEHTNSHLYLNLSHPTVNSSLDGHLVSALFLLFYQIASSTDPHSFSLRSLPSPSRPVARFDLKRTNLFFDPKPFAPLDRFASGRKSSPPPCLYCTTPCALVHRPHALFTTHTPLCNADAISLDRYLRQRDQASSSVFALDHPLHIAPHINYPTDPPVYTDYPRTQTDCRPPAALSAVRDVLSGGMEAGGSARSQGESRLRSPTGVVNVGGMSLRAICEGLSEKRSCASERGRSV